MANLVSLETNPKTFLRFSTGFNSASTIAVPSIIYPVTASLLGCRTSRITV